MVGSPAPLGILNVAVVASDPLARSGMTARLAAAPGVHVVAESGPPSTAAKMPHADVLLWDLGAQADLPPLERRGTSPPPVVALVADTEAGVDALHAGARGTAWRDASAEVLAATLRAAALGQAVHPGAVLDAALPPRHHAQPDDDDPALNVEKLTPRERQVLTLLVAGLSNKAIAAQLGISNHTAKFHVTAVTGKLGVQRRAEVAARAARAGWIRL